MRALLLFVLVATGTLPAPAHVVTFGWESGDPVLGMYGTGDPPLYATFAYAPDPVHTGSMSLCLEDNSPSGTPYAYVAWVGALVDGDDVEASVWRYDTTPGVSPSCRIWAHWNDDPGDVNSYAGYAGGNTDYGPGEGWDLTSWSWTVADGHTGLVIQVRVYSNPGDVVWVDDLTVTAPNHAWIHTPEGVGPVQESSWSRIKALWR